MSACSAHPARCQHVTGAHHQGQCSKCNWEAGGGGLDSVTRSSQGALVHLLESEVIFFFFFLIWFIGAAGKHFPSPQLHKGKVTKGLWRWSITQGGGC